MTRIKRKGACMAPVGLNRASIQVLEQQLGLPGFGAEPEVRRKAIDNLLRALYTECGEGEQPS